MLSELEIGATAALYGLENEEVVKEHFDELYAKQVQCFDDDAFIAKLQAMKGRATTTVGVSVPFKDDTICFVNKLWFNVQRSSSEYWEVVYIGIGVNFKRHEYNQFSFSKLWIAHTANGTIEQIKEKIASPDFKERIGSRLQAHVYDSCEKQMNELLSNND